MRIVAPAALSSRMSSMIDAPVVLSRFPVGSSASMIAGRPGGGPAVRSPRAPPSGRLGGLEVRACGEAAPFERLVRAPVPLGGRDAGVEQPAGAVLPRPGRFGRAAL